MAPLTGVRVVEMEAIGPLLHAGMLLADLGADVVRVVRPSRDDAPDGAADAMADEAEQTDRRLPFGSETSGTVDVNPKDPKA